MGRAQMAQFFNRFIGQFTKLVLSYLLEILTTMARTGSNIPPGARSRSQETTQVRGKPTGRGRQGEESLTQPTQRQPTTQAQKPPADQFSQSTLSTILKQMKEQVTRQTDKPFDPTKLVRSRLVERTDLEVKTEELRTEMRKAAQLGKKAKLSAFEKVFLEFFIGKRTLGSLLQAGEKKFRKKALEQWKEFFERLYGYTKEKQSEVDQIIELIFRGISEQDPRPKMAENLNRNSVLVCDLVTKRRRRNRTDKFVRLPIIDTKMKEFLSKLAPGDRIEAEKVVEWYGSAALQFLMLYHRPVRKGLSLERGEPTAKRIAQQADAAARAREAFLKSEMAKKPTSTEKRETPESEELYKKKALLDKLLS